MTIENCVEISADGKANKSCCGQKNASNSHLYSSRFPCILTGANLSPVRSDTNVPCICVDVQTERKHASGIGCKVYKIVSTTNSPFMTVTAAQEELVAKAASTSAAPSPWPVALVRLASVT